MTLPLPHPVRDAGLGRLLDRRRSTRTFGTGPIALDDLAALLWAAHGLRSDGGRTTPSAHALHGLALTVVAGHVDGLAPGLHGYHPHRHELRELRPGDHRPAFAATSLADGAWLPTAAALVLISADVGATNAHFAGQPPLGRRGERYTWLEAGHMSQSLYLAAAVRGLGAVLVAGLDDDRLREVVGDVAPPDPLGLVAVGWPA